MRVYLNPVYSQLSAVFLHGRISFFLYPKR